MASNVRKKVLGAALAASLMAGAALAAGPAASAGSLPKKFDRSILADWASPRAIVMFDRSVTQRTMARLAAAGVTQAVRLDSIDAVGVLGPISTYKAIARWSDVIRVDEDAPLILNNYGAKKDTQVTEVRKGSKPLHRKYTGKGVTVAVIDTGIQDTHPDLDGQVLKHLNFEPGYFMDMINDGVYSDQLVEATGNPIDSYGHGTHVAGIVAGTGAAGVGADYSGVAPGAKLVNFKIADAWEGVDCSVPCDFGWELNALVAYEYLIEHAKDKEFGPHGIQVATNSWSIYEVDSDAEPITLIVQKAADEGIINLFAAGNDGPGDNTVAQGPNSLEDVITVAAACKAEDSCGKGQIAGFSSRGPQVDIAAPGESIYSTIAHASVYWGIGGHNAPGDPANRFYYTGLSGTSMATPHVAGIVALMLEANPKLNEHQVEKILTKTATDYGDKGFDTSWGYGEVNAFKAVAKAE